MSQRAARRSSEPGNSITKELREYRCSKRNPLGCFIENSDTYDSLDRPSWRFSRTAQQSSDHYHSLSWQILIGNFEYEMVLKPQSAAITNITMDPDSHRRDICFFKAKYIAPLWFSNTVFQVTYQTWLQCGTTSWYRDLSFGMYNTNPDPSLLECLDSGDAEGLRHLFRQGRARATDYLANGETLLRVRTLPAAWVLPTY